MVVANRARAFNPDSNVFALIPLDPGATSYQFGSGSDGNAVIDYRGSGSTADVCVRAVLLPSGSVVTKRWSCSPR